MGMTGLFDFMWDALAALMANSAVVMALQLVGAYLAILWLASSFWVYRDLGRRTRDRISPFFAGALVILFTPLLFPLALVAYRIARPPDTLDERRVGELQQALLELDAERSECARCAYPVEAAWVRCPDCRAQLAVTCGDCENPMALDWTVCAWCAADVPWGVDEQTEPGLEPVPTAQPVGRPVLAPERVPAPAPGSATARAAGSPWPLPAEGFLERDSLLGRISRAGVVRRIDEAFASVSLRGVSARLGWGTLDVPPADRAVNGDGSGNGSAAHNGAGRTSRAAEVEVTGAGASKAQTKAMQDIELLRAGRLGPMPMIASEPLPELGAAAAQAVPDEASSWAAVAGTPTDGEADGRAHDREADGAMTVHAGNGLGEGRRGVGDSSGASDASSVPAGIRDQDGSAGHANTRLARHRRRGRRESRPAAYRQR
jgi:hypothetical protein